jgi:hypothetical protein
LDTSEIEKQASRKKDELFKNIVGDDTEELAAMEQEIEEVGEVDALTDELIKDHRRKEEKNQEKKQVARGTKNNFSKQILELDDDENEAMETELDKEKEEEEEEEEELAEEEGV